MTQANRFAIQMGSMLHRFATLLGLSSHAALGLRVAQALCLAALLFSPAFGEANGDPAWRGSSPSLLWFDGTQNSAFLQPILGTPNSGSTCLLGKASNSTPVHDCGTSSFLCSLGNLFGKVRTEIVEPFYIGWRPYVFTLAKVRTADFKLPVIGLPAPSASTGADAWIYAVGDPALGGRLRRVWSSSRVGNTLNDRWHSFWNIVQPFYMDGETYLLLYGGGEGSNPLHPEGNGVATISHVTAPLPAPNDFPDVEDVWAGNFGTGWTTIKPFYQNGEVYLLLFRNTDSAVQIRRIDGNLRGADVVWNGKWPGQWLEVEPFYKPTYIRDEKVYFTIP